MTQEEIKDFVKNVNEALEQLDVIADNFSLHIEYIVQLFSNLVDEINK